MIKHLANPTAHRPAEPIVMVALQQVAKLNQEFPEAWHVVMQAENRCRGQQFDRYRNQRELIRQS